MVALFIISIINVSEMRQFSPVSVRYDEPFSGQAAYQLRRFSIGQGENTFWPTFWHEKEAKIESALRSVNAHCILFSGDASLVLPTDYVTGAAPGVTDGSGCAVSSAMANELWGGSDVAGQPVTIDGVERTIRGVFEHDQLIALLSVSDEDTSQSFTAIELSGSSSSTTRADIENYISRAGLPAPDRILLDRPTLLASFLAFLPLIILTVYLAVCLFIRLKKRALVIYLIVFTVFLGLAFTLPLLLDLLPTWLIPSRFSDFSFWGDMIRQLGDDFREHMWLTPRLRDVSYMILFYKQIGIALISVALAAILCCRHRSKNIAPDSIF